LAQAKKWGFDEVDMLPADYPKGSYCTKWVQNDHAWTGAQDNVSNEKTWDA
jgi:hypothetical protein